MKHFYLILIIGLILSCGASLHGQSDFGLKVNGLKSSKFEKINLYPNPAIDFFIVEMALGNIEVNLYDVLGSCLISKNISYSEKINIEFLPKGFYIVELRKEGALLALGKLMKN